MRDLFKKAMTGSMIAGAALLVAACGGGGGDAANNTAATEMDATDPMMEGTTNDVTAIDGANGADANLGMDANTTMDANMTGNMGGNMMNTTDADTGGNATNGM
jgi:hypothetical protein